MGCRWNREWKLVILFVQGASQCILLKVEGFQGDQGRS